MQLPRTSGHSLYANQPGPALKAKDTASSQIVNAFPNLLCMMNQRFTLFRNNRS